MSVSKLWFHRTTEGEPALTLVTKTADGKEMAEVHLLSEQLFDNWVPSIAETPKVNIIGKNFQRFFYNKLEPYQQRVVEEYDELEKKLVKLEAFIHDEGTHYKLLDVREQVRLLRQYTLMRLYSEVLDERIKEF